MDKPELQPFYDQIRVAHIRLAAIRYFARHRRRPPSGLAPVLVAPHGPHRPNSGAAALELPTD